MKTKPILRIAVPTPLRRLFHYLPSVDCDPYQIKKGARVKIPFKNRELIGVFIDLVYEADVAETKLKAILNVIDAEPVLSEEVLQLCFWAADYYHYAIGEVIEAALPQYLRKGKTLRIPKKNLPDKKWVSTTPLQLNEEQANAVSKVIAALNTFQGFLLHGITGSGKTEVYLQTIQTVIDSGEQVLVLVPEIGLTPQTINRFRERFQVEVCALHSALSERDRLQTYLDAKANKTKIIIGTRSAVFTPFEKLGLIIVDEEHDLSFKQQDTFRYHARDLAIKRAQTNQIPIILGSATPSLETLHNVKNKKYELLKLSTRAGNATLPQYHLIDIRNAMLEHGLSPTLLAEIKKHLSANNQVMLFLNRRGFSPVLMCHGCGFVFACKRCDARMTYHQSRSCLHCHHCDSQRKIPTQCEQCKESLLHPVGMGTERLEDALKKYFAEYPIVRIDRDSTKRKGEIEKLLNKIQDNEYAILIGTQMLAKGHHFPNVTLVAIVDADGGFFSSDFRAMERMGQVLLQVAGRSGRVEKQGHVFIQTRQPDHPLLLSLIHHGYEQYAELILNERKETLLPPYSYIALFRAEGYALDTAMLFLKNIKSIAVPEKGIHMLGPIPAPMSKKQGRHRAQLLLQSTSRKLLQEYLNKLVPGLENLRAKGVRWSLDIDPMEMI